MEIRRRPGGAPPHPHPEGSSTVAEVTAAARPRRPRPRVASGVRPRRSAEEEQPPRHRPLPAAAPAPRRGCLPQSLAERRRGPGRLSPLGRNAPAYPRSLQRRLGERLPAESPRVSEPSSARSGRRPGRESGCRAGASSRLGGWGRAGGGGSRGYLRGRRGDTARPGGAGAQRSLAAGGRRSPRARSCRRSRGRRCSLIASSRETGSLSLGQSWPVPCIFASAPLPDSVHPQSCAPLPTAAGTQLPPHVPWCSLLSSGSVVLVGSLLPF